LKPNDDQFAVGFNHQVGHHGRQTRSHPDSGGESQRGTNLAQDNRRAEVFSWESLGFALRFMNQTSERVDDRL
jgi:hypothetical protein